MTEQFFLPHTRSPYKNRTIQCPKHGEQEPFEVWFGDMKVELCAECVGEMLLKQIRARGGYAKKVEG